MKEYNYTPEQIDRMDFFNTLELVFDEYEEQADSVPTVRYADEIPFW